MEKKAADTVRAAIQQYTIRQRCSKEAVELDFTLSDEQVRAIDSAAYRLAIRGGAEPWLGSQRYEILLEGGKPSSSRPSRGSRPRRWSQSAPLIGVRSAGRRRRTAAAETRRRQ